jgi:hypothetical protein
VNAAAIDHLAFWSAVGASSLGLIGLSRRTASSLTLIGTLVAVGGAAWLAFRCWNFDASLILTPLRALAPTWSVALTLSEASVLAAHVCLVALLAHVQFARADASPRVSRWWIAVPLATNVALTMDDRSAAAMAFLTAVALSNALDGDGESPLTVAARTLAGLLAVAAALIASGDTDLVAEYRLVDRWPAFDVDQTLIMAAIISMLSVTSMRPGVDHGAGYSSAMPMILTIVLLFQTESAAVGNWASACIIAALALMALAWVIAAYRSRLSADSVDRWMAALNCLAAIPWFFSQTLGAVSLITVAAIAVGIKLTLGSPAAGSHATRASGPGGRAVSMEEAIEIELCRGFMATERFTAAGVGRPVRPAVIALLMAVACAAALFSTSPTR